MFNHTSRYDAIDTAHYQASGGRNISYKRRRFLPQGKQLSVLQEVVVNEGDRLDLIAYAGLSDPEQFWQICDANNAMNPSELTAEIGRVLRIPEPQA